MAIYHKDYCFEIVVENKTYIKYPSMAVACSIHVCRWSPTRFNQQFTDLTQRKTIFAPVDIDTAQTTAFIIISLCLISHRHLL